MKTEKEVKWVDTLKDGDIYYSIVLGPQQRSVTNIIYLGVWGENPEADRVAVETGNIFMSPETAKEVYAKIRDIFKAEGSETIVEDSVTDEDAFYEECKQVAAQIIPDGFVYEWMEDDHRQAIRVWLKDYGMIYSMLWMDTFASVEEFKDRLMAEVATLESYRPIGLEAGESLTFADVYDACSTVEDISDSDISFDDFTLWYVRAIRSKEISFMAEGNDLIGKNYKIAQALESDLGVDALKSFAGVEVLMLRVVDKEEGIRYEWVVELPRFEDLHLMLRGLSDIIKAPHNFREIIEEGSVTVGGYYIDVI